MNEGPVTFRRVWIINDSYVSESSPTAFEDNPERQVCVFCIGKLTYPISFVHSPSSRDAVRNHVL